MLAALAWGSPSSVGLAWSQPKSDWEEDQDQRNWKEGEAVLPAFPQSVDLVEFEVSASTTFRFFIDRASLRVGEDGVVRYTLVARSPHGAETISFEGIRCNGGQVRIYAAGRRDGTWSPRLKSDWSEIQAKTIQRWHQVLRREYFCPQDAIIFDAAEGVDALQRGGHPRKAFTER
jgi:hypothetical protein